MRFKKYIRSALSNVDMVYMNAATELAEKFDEDKITYDELIQLREYFSLTSPRYYKELFDMIEECLLRIGLQNKSTVTILCPKCNSSNTEAKEQLDFDLLLQCNACSWVFESANGIADDHN